VDLHEVDDVRLQELERVVDLWSASFRKKQEEGATGAAALTDLLTASYEKSYAVVCSSYSEYSPHLEARKYSSRRSLTALPMRSSLSR